MKSFFQFLFILLLLISCQDAENTEQEYYVVEKYQNDSSDDDLYSIKPRPGYQYYKNKIYPFALEYPKDWNVHETQPEDSLQVINFFSVQDTYSHQFPILLNAKAQLSQVSFFPKGLGTELPMGLARPIKGYERDLPISFSIDENESKVFFLENLQVYGYFLKPSSPPPGWTKDGFIFAQIAVDGYYFTCFDISSGVEKSREDCEPMKGDKIRKYDNVNNASRKAVLDILSSVQFYEDIDNPHVISEEIKILSPEPYQEVESPLTVSGEAIKFWYHNSEFPIIVTDAEYQILATVKAKTTEKEGKEGFIPFEVTLDYKNPIFERGYLIMKRANPSGKLEQDRSIIIPITFSDLNVY